MIFPAPRHKSRLRGWAWIHRRCSGHCRCRRWGRGSRAAASDGCGSAVHSYAHWTLLGPVYAAIEIRTATRLTANPTIPFDEVTHCDVLVRGDVFAGVP